MHIHHQGYQRQKCKIGSKRVRKGSRGRILKFWDPLHNSGTVRGRNIKFGMQNHHQGTERQKLGQKGSGRGHVVEFRNFGTPSISRERLEVERPNFACTFITRGTNDRNAKLGQKGSGNGEVTYCRNSGTPCISRERLELKHQILHADHHQGY